MVTYQSIIERRGEVSFPDFAGERVYMREFRKRDGLPANLSHWQPTVDAMLDGVATDGPIYLMIDQAFVRAGTPHRRPGIHVDGYWHPGVSAHGGGGGIPPAHRPVPSHRSTPTHRSVPDVRQPYSPGTHLMGAGGHGWKHASFVEPEGIILAASVPAARGYRGAYAGEIGEGGDCSQIDIAALDPVLLESGRVFAGNVCCLHESVGVRADCYRTVVRLNVPGWSPAQGTSASG